MTIPQIFVLLVLAIPLTLVFLDRLREDVAAMGMAALLGGAQYLGMGVLGKAHSPDEAGKALAGFGTPEVITLMSLFILTYALDKFGLTRWLAGRLLAIGGTSERRLIGLFALTGALLSLFMNTLAAGALLLPGALEASRRTGVKPSKLLIPVAYGTMLGGAATYLTTANIVISSLLPLADPPQESLSIFAFTPTGGVVAIAGLVFLYIFGSRLLPDREPPEFEQRYSVGSQELADTYQLEERLWEMKILPNSTRLINHRIEDTPIGSEFGLTVPAVRREGVLMSAEGAGRLQADDVLVVIGREDRVQLLAQMGTRVIQHRDDEPHEIQTPGMVLTEILIPPRSPLQGKTLREVAFRAKYGFMGVALWRDNRSYRTDVGKTLLRPGDSLLLIGPGEKVAQLTNQQEFVVTQSTGAEMALNHTKVGVTLAIVVTALASMFAGVPVELAMFAAAALLLLTRLLTPEEAYQAVKWRAIFLIAGTIAVSTAMVETGLARLIGNDVVHLVEPFGAMGVIAGAYLMSALLTQVMGGQISPLVVGPIAISAAIRLDVNPQAVAVVTAIAGSVSFITPLSHPVNILMIAPANYQFRDFVKSGWVLTVVCFIALMIAVPLFWKL